jgi:hypothetical protein
MGEKIGADGQHFPTVCILDKKIRLMDSAARFWGQEIPSGLSMSLSKCGIIF